LRRTDAKPTFVMMTDCSWTYYAQMRAEMGPDVLIEMRRTEPNDYQPVDDPERRADEWWERNQVWIMAIPPGDNTIIAGYNEKPKSEAALFCRFELRRMGHLHNSAHRAAVGSWGVGCPDLDEWISYAPLRMAMCKGDVWDFHEYASDLADIDNRWHVGRFTLPVVAANLGDWPIVVSEFGYDIVEGKGQPGWQLQPGANDETCLAMLRKGGEFYDTQKRVLGVAAYQQGSNDAKFRAFNMWGIQRRLVAEYAAGAVILPPPVSTPTPPIATPTLILAPPIHNFVRISWGWAPPDHLGIDFSCFEGTPVYAAMDGIAYNLTDIAYTGGFGRYVRIEGQGHKVYTAHLSEWGVANGTRVTAGQQIGLSGNTGNTTGPHMHFEVRRVSGSPYKFGAIDPTGLIVWPANTPVPQVYYLPTNDPATMNAVGKERFVKIRWWLEEEERQRGDDDVYADSIHSALIALVGEWGE
jgi:hypothetical protein